MLHFKNLFMEDKKTIPGGFKTGTVPPNKRIFTAEEEAWIRENHNKVTKTVMAEKFGLVPTTIGRIFRRMGLKKTDEEIKDIMSKKTKPSKEAIDAYKFKMRKIEGGGRGGLKPNYHLTIWRERNGDFSTKNILVYKTGNYDSFDDLVLIRKTSYEKFLEKRKQFLVRKEAKLEKNKLSEAENLIKKSKQEETQKKRDEKRAIARKIAEEKEEKAALKYQQGAAARKKREDAERQQAIFDSIKANTKPKSIQQANSELLDKDLVPVKLDAKTTVWVKRSKCVFVDGAWVKQTPLNIHLQTNDKFGRPIPFFKPGHKDENNSTKNQKGL